MIMMIYFEIYIFLIKLIIEFLYLFKYIFIKIEYK